MYPKGLGAIEGRWRRGPSLPATTAPAWLGRRRLRRVERGRYGKASRSDNRRESHKQDEAGARKFSARRPATGRHRRDDLEMVGYRRSLGALDAGEADVLAVIGREVDVPIRIAVAFNHMNSISVRRRRNYSFNGRITADIKPIAVRIAYRGTPRPRRTFLGKTGGCDANSPDYPGHIYRPDWRGGSSVDPSTDKRGLRRQAGFR